MAGGHEAAPVPPSNTENADVRRMVQIAYGRPSEAVLAAADRDAASGDSRSLARLWRQKPIALNPEGGVGLLFDSHVDADSARTATGLTRGGDGDGVRLGE